MLLSASVLGVGNTKNRGLRPPLWREEMKVIKIKAGKYQVTAQGFVFTLTNEINTWVLSNKSDTEVMRDSTKTAILDALLTYDGHGLESLNTQEWCAY